MAPDNPTEYHTLTHAIIFSWQPYWQGHCYTGRKHWPHCLTHLVSDLLLPTENLNKQLLAHVTSCDLVTGGAGDTRDAGIINFS